MRGSIKNYNLPQPTKTTAITQFKADSDYHTLLTIGFIRNFISYNIEQNKDWKNYYVDRKRFNSREFAFRLVDLEFIINDFSKQYAKYYLNDILFTCNPLAIKDLTNNQQSDRFNLELQWTCKCSIVGVNPSPAVLGTTLVTQISMSPLVIRSVWD